jgi:2-polyprenyl-3-methyl-5-hydroxy-6-metoxy-1,4-benzoquinol methylase
VAQQIISLAADELDTFVRDYDFICEVQRREEIFFRRHGSYRLQSTQEAVREVYGNPQFMRRYMRGLLLTQLFWSNHTASLNFYLREFLEQVAWQCDLLEIGPGHGLLLSHAATSARVGSVSAWDVSPASIAETRAALRKLGIERSCRLETRDLFDCDSSGDAFDAIVFSEVLEHLEEPGRALRAIRSICRRCGRVYLNVPVNSPAPDHLFLLRSPEAALEFVESHGFKIERMGLFPATNYSLDDARKHSVTISVCIVASARDV